MRGSWRLADPTSFKSPPPGIGRLEMIKPGEALWGNGSRRGVEVADSKRRQDVELSRKDRVSFYDGSKRKKAMGGLSALSFAARGSIGASGSYRANAESFCRPDEVAL
jgi:hypothetical protein